MSDFASIAAATSGTTDDEASKKFGSTAGATFSFGTATFAAPAATAAAAAGGEDDEEGGDDNANPEVSCFTCLRARLSCFLSVKFRYIVVGVRMYE